MPWIEVEPDVWVPNQLQSAANKLKQGEAVPPITVRELLRWWEAKRRGVYIVEGIQEGLKSLQLTTEPDFREPWIDAEIRLLLAVPAPENNSIAASAGVSQVQSEVPSSTLLSSIPDPTFRIGRLPTASAGVVSVSPNAELSEAITVMLQNDFSQLPVMTGERTVKGVISWKSIARRLALGGECKQVQQCLGNLEKSPSPDRLSSIQ